MRYLYVVALCILTGSPSWGADSIESRYKKTCGICHESSVGGAPKRGDIAAWFPRIEKGMDVLLESVKNGKGAMPPTGICFDCSVEDYVALINYMTLPQ